MIYYTVKDTQEKIKALIHTIDLHFSQKEKISIIAANEKAIDFVSQLLWSFPKESMRPHCVKGPCSSMDSIILSLAGAIQESTPFVFNLTQEALELSSSMKVLYELEDLSSPEKAISFQNKFHCYRKAGVPISAGTLI